MIILGSIKNNKANTSLGPTMTIENKRNLQNFWSPHKSLKIWQKVSFSISAIQKVKITLVLTPVYVGFLVPFFSFLVVAAQ